MGKSAIFSFDVHGQRMSQDRFENSNASGTPSEVTVYVGGLYEKVGAGTNFEHKHYIMAPTGRVGVYTDRTTIVRDTRFFHSDGLGSITTVTDERGRVLRRQTYDPWGRQSIRYTNTGPGIINAAPTTRGFTDHEGLNDFGLIHMNGRVYDPVLGRFLSADPFIDDAGDSQSYNRYSYVNNNPLNHTDPSGYFKLKDALKIVAIVVAAYFTAGWAIGAFGVSSAGVAGSAFAGGLQAAGFSAGVINGIIGGAAAGFASGFSGSLLNGGSIGDAFKAGVIGGAVGAVTGGILGKIGGMELNSFERGLAHGAVHGGAAEATGGEFRHGFYSGFLNGSLDGRIESTFKNSETAQYAAAAVVGGTGSVLGGGKFANGAVSGAFSYLFNQQGGQSGWGSRIKRFFGGDPDGGFLGTSLTPKEFFGAAGSGAKDGYYAWADGLNPFGDFYADMGYYDTNDSALQWSQRFGGLSGAAGSSLMVVGGGGIIAARGGFTLSRHVAGQVGAGGRYWSETAVRQAFGSGRAMLNTGEGVGKLMTTVRYSVGNGGAVVRNVFTNKIVHYLPKW